MAKSSANGKARCMFSLAAGAGPRFCGAPALPGSAYCRHHHRLCLIEPGSVAAGRAIRDLEREAARSATVPDELAFLASVAVAELDSADEPRDIAACLDLVPHNDLSDD
jgi:hypothetical protein